MFKKLDTIFLCANDMQASAKFYRDILGLKQVADDPNRKSFSFGQTTLILRPWEPDTEDERHVKYGISLCFHVADVDAITRELESLGAHLLVAPREDELGRYAEIADPDGYIIMLLGKSR
jgi:predicted enzyme related to lactoylglutathione lyase